MKVKNNKLETFVYVLTCLFTLGLAAIIRVVITQGVRMALEDSK